MKLRTLSIGAGAGLAAIAVAVPVALAATGGGSATSPAAMAQDGTTAQQPMRMRAGMQPDMGHGSFRGGPGAHRGSHTGDLKDVAAAELGVTVEDLRAALTSGTSILDVATGKGKDATQFTAAVTAGVRANIEAALAAGDIDQEHADKILADLDAHVAQVLASTHEGRGHGGPKGGCDHDEEAGASDAAQTT